MFFDPLYLVFSLPALIVGGIASLLMNYWTGKYFKQENVNHLTGVDVVEKLARSQNLQLKLDVNPGRLSDHYDPRDNTLSLSADVARKTSITSVSIAAHEVGHAIQHQTGNFLIQVRSLLVPAVNIGTNVGYFLLIIGIIIGFVEMAWLGIILFSTALVFSLLTLPVEIDASRRALALLEEEQLLYHDEMSGAKKVLTAAALTYVAATLQSLGSLAYFFFRIQGINRD